MTLIETLINFQMDNEIDEQGRPLGEQRSTLSNDSLRTIYISCLYPGSRCHHKNPMNVSALKQVRGTMPEILSWFSLIREDILKRNQKKSLSYLDLWIMVSRASLVPLFAKLEGIAPIPAYAAAIYKVAFGLIAVTMKLSMQETRNKDTPLSADYIYKFADESGDLVGSKEVCAAPARLIKEVVHCMIYGHSEEMLPVYEDSSFVTRFLEFSHYAVSFQFSFIYYILMVRNFYSPFENTNNQQHEQSYQSYRNQMRQSQDEDKIPPIYQIEDLLDLPDLKIFCESLRDLFYNRSRLSNDVKESPELDVKSKIIMRDHALDFEMFHSKNLAEHLQATADALTDYREDLLTPDVIRKIVNPSPISFFDESYW